MSTSLLDAVTAYMVCNEWLQNKRTGVIENIPNRVHYLNRWKKVSGMYTPLFKGIVETGDYIIDTGVLNYKTADPVRRSYLRDDVDEVFFDKEISFLMHICEGLMYDDEVRAAVYCGTVEGPAERFMTEQSLLMTAIETKYGIRPTIRLCWIDPDNMIIPHLAKVYNAFVCADFEDYYEGMSDVSDEAYKIVTVTDH